MVLNILGIKSENLLASKFNLKLNLQDYQIAGTSLSFN